MKSSGSFGSSSETLELEPASADDPDARTLWLCEGCQQKSSAGNDVAILHLDDELEDFGLPSYACEHIRDRILSAYGVDEFQDELDPLAT